MISNEACTRCMVQGSQRILDYILHQTRCVHFCLLQIHVDHQDRYDRIFLFAIYGNLQLRLVRTLLCNSPPSAFLSTFDLLASSETAVTHFTLSLLDEP